MQPSICPVCEGVCTVPASFYTREPSTSASREPCRSCGGTGVVWPPDTETYTVNVAPEDAFGWPNAVSLLWPSSTISPSFALPPEAASCMSDRDLAESRTTLNVEAEYRDMARTTEIPDGYRVVREGISQDGDKRWCPEHGWEDAEDGCAYWSFNLLIRPKEDA